MEFCDLDCQYASFPDSASVDGSRSGRTFIALFLKKRSLVHKNLLCAEKKPFRASVTGIAYPPYLGIFHLSLERLRKSSLSAK
jgi:hypothetical protein